MVREETGLTVKAGRLLKVRSGFRYRIEIYYEAVLVGGLDGLTLDPKEVLEARLFSPVGTRTPNPRIKSSLVRSTCAVTGPFRATCYLLRCQHWERSQHNVA
jgi:8-oxo-dGTP diphosphatase